MLVPIQSKVMTVPSSLKSDGPAFGQILDAVSDGIFIYDGKGTLLVRNQRGRQMFGRSEEQLLARAKYVREQQKEGDGNGNINRELAALKRAFTRATRAGKIGSVPLLCRCLKRTTHAADSWIT